MHAKLCVVPQPPLRGGGNHEVLGAHRADALQLRVIRIDLAAKTRQVVGDDETLFNFPSSLGFLPPIAGVAPLMVVSNQQHRTPLLNDAITTDMTQPPFIVTKAVVLP